MEFGSDKYLSYIKELYDTGEITKKQSEQARAFVREWDSIKHKFRYVSDNKDVEYKCKLVDLLTDAANVKGSKWSGSQNVENQQYNHEKVMYVYKNIILGAYIYPIILGNLSYTSRMGSRYDFKREAKVYTAGKYKAGAFPFC